MASSRLADIAGALIAAGKDPATPAALVQWGTLPGQKTVVAPLADLADHVNDAGAGPPARVVVGEVVARRPALDWFESLPLFGRRILITRPRDEIERSAAPLEALGAEVLAAPTVEIRPLDDPGPLDDALRRLADFDWLVFTSANGVRHLLDRLAALELDLRALGPLKLAAIGPATAEALAGYRLRADVVPPDHTSEGLCAALAPRVEGRRVLLARADRGRTLLQDEISRIARVEQVPVYRNVDAEALPDDVVKRLAEGSVDWITLTSSAITERLHALLPEPVRSQVGSRVRLASLSPITTSTARKLGWTISAEAAPYTWDGLIGAILTAERGSADGTRRPADASTPG
jgi:uroporphyrinogen III methyltransferase/synthase